MRIYGSLNLERTFSGLHAPLCILFCHYNDTYIYSTTCIELTFWGSLFWGCWFKDLASAEKVFGLVHKHFIVHSQVLH